MAESSAQNPPRSSFDPGAPKQKSATSSEVSASGSEESALQKRNSGGHARDGGAGDPIRGDIREDSCLDSCLEEGSRKGSLEQRASVQPFDAESDSDTERDAADALFSSDGVTLMPSESAPTVIDLPPLASAEIPSAAVMPTVADRQNVSLTPELLAAIEEHGADEERIVTARGTEDGLVLRIDGHASWTEIVREVEAFLGGRRKFFEGGEIGIEWLERLPTVEQGRELESLLRESYGMEVRVRRRRAAQLSLAKPDGSSLDESQRLQSREAQLRDGLVTREEALHASEASPLGTSAVGTSVLGTSAPGSSSAASSTGNRYQDELAISDFGRGDSNRVRASGRPGSSRPGVRPVSGDASRPLFSSMNDTLGSETGFEEERFTFRPGGVAGRFGKQTFGKEGFGKEGEVDMPRASRTGSGSASRSSSRSAASRSNVFSGPTDETEGGSELSGRRLSSRVARMLGDDLFFDDDANARVYFGTLRSGQRLETPFSLIVVGDVNPGADLVAGGDIVVFGSLRGTAHASAYDDEAHDRVIIALQMQPMQLRIGSVISRGSDECVRGAEIARIDNRRVIVEAFNPRAAGIKKTR